MGMFHEHQNDVSGGNPFQFNSQAVINYYQSLGYSAQEAQQLAYTNVIDRYECTDSNCPYAGSSFDKESIMLYPIDTNWLMPGTSSNWVNVPRFEYSSTDKEWLQKMYPFGAAQKPIIKVQFLDGEDWQRYWVKKMVIESLQPNVGVTFEFPQLNGETKVPNYIPTSQPFEFSDSNKKVAIIAGSVVGGLIVLFVLMSMFDKKKHR
jgi:hypothetical protein